MDWVTTNGQNAAAVHLVSLLSATVGTSRRLLLKFCTSFLGEVRERQVFCNVYLPNDAKAAKLVTEFVCETVWGWIEGQGMPWAIECERWTVDLWTHDRGVSLSTFLVAGGLAHLDGREWTPSETWQVFLRLGRPPVASNQGPQP